MDAGTIDPGWNDGWKRFLDRIRRLWETPRRDLPAVMSTSKLTGLANVDPAGPRILSR